MYLDHEHVNAPDSGAHEGCDDCPHALVCVAGNYNYGFYIARTREEQRKGLSLPCVDDGKVRLVVLDEGTAVARYRDDLEALLKNASLKQVDENINITLDAPREVTWTVDSNAVRDPQSPYTNYPYTYPIKVK